MLECDGRWEVSPFPSWEFLCPGTKGEKGSAPQDTQDFLFGLILFTFFFSLLSPMSIMVVPCRAIPPADKKHFLKTKTRFFKCFPPFVSFFFQTFRLFFLSFSAL